MSESNDSGLTVLREGAVEIWTINRPDRMNALSRALVRSIGREARRVTQDPAGVRAVILTGKGDRAFCAGADLKERTSMTEADVRDFLSLYRISFRYLERLPVPVVAALNGVAYGGGLELALCCDLRVARAGIKLGLTETSLGIIPGAGGTQRLTRLVGVARAKELILFARRLEAAAALELGILNALAAPEQSALDFARAFVEPLLNGAPIAQSAALAAVDAAGELELEAGLSFERECYERTLVSQDRLEALAAFHEKRKPEFKGR